MIQENTPAKVGLLELLLASSGVQFVIPAYQRDYSWKSNSWLGAGAYNKYSKPLDFDGFRISSNV